MKYAKINYHHLKNYKKYFNEDRYTYMYFVVKVFIIKKYRMLRFIILIKDRNKQINVSFLINAQNSYTVFLVFSLLLKIL